MSEWFEEWELTIRFPKQKADLLTQNTRLLRSLGRVQEKKLNQIADELHENVFTVVDCLQCANCCKSIPPIVNETDAKRIARYLKIKITVFKDRYLRFDEDGDPVMSQAPCPFLQEDNFCSIYDVRPRACREYPHTDNQTFKKNIQLHAINAQYCPAVHHILKALKSVSL